MYALRIIIILILLPILFFAHSRVAEAQAVTANKAGKTKEKAESACVPPGLEAGKTWPQNSYALVIGTSSYGPGWDQLPKAASDAQRVATALKDQCFEVEPLALNLPADQLKSRIENFIADKGGEPSARLLLYYSGHVHTLARRNGSNQSDGYIVAADTPSPAAASSAVPLDIKKENEFKRKAISIASIREPLGRANAKWRLAVFDSCFSDSMISRNSGDSAEVLEPVTLDLPPLADTAVPTQPKSSAPGSVMNALKNPVVRVMTAGSQSADQVRDGNDFTTFFVDAINGHYAQQFRSPKFLTGAQLGGFISDQVSDKTNSKQNPITTRWSGVGDFVFYIPPTRPESRALGMPLPAKDPPLVTPDLKAHELADQCVRSEKLALASAIPLVKDLATYLSTHRVKYRADLFSAVVASKTIQDILPHEIVSAKAEDGKLVLTLSHQSGEMVLHPIFGAPSQQPDANLETLQGGFKQLSSYGCIAVTFDRDKGEGFAEFTQLSGTLGVVPLLLRKPNLRLTLRATPKKG